MTIIAIASIAALSFAAAAWAGTLIAGALCAGRVPYADGPAPVAVGRVPFGLSGACVGAALALHGESALHLALLLIVVLALAGCAAADFACGALPDVFTVGALVLVVAAGAAARNVAPALGAATIALPVSAAALATRGRGMGWGDVKLAALGGALLGVADAMFAFLLAAVAAYVIARRGAGVRGPIAFGPYLAASIAVTLTVVRII
ncbi:MAG: hypothetical protein QOD51_2771 [Candidatus Eremiobacteraeota bacterium]|nr:hypothetical protein [Candidatus Eremiobacteraeota bacterium]